MAARVSRPLRYVPAGRFYDDHKTNNFYSRECERAIIWNDSFLNIQWPFTPNIISEKDLQASKVENAELFSR